MYITGERKTRTPSQSPEPTTGDSSALRQDVGSEQELLINFFFHKRISTQIIAHGKQHIARS